MRAEVPPPSLRREEGREGKELLHHHHRHIIHARLHITITTTTQSKISEQSPGHHPPGLLLPFLTSVQFIPRTGVGHLVHVASFLFSFPMYGVQAGLVWLAGGESFFINIFFLSGIFRLLASGVHSVSLIAEGELKKD